MRVRKCLNLGFTLTAILTVVLSKSSTWWQYCSIAMIRSNNSFMFSWRWQYVLKSNKCLIFISRIVWLVILHVHSPGWSDRSEHQLPVSDRLWTLWVPGFPSTGLGLRPYTEEENRIWNNFSLWRFRGFHFIPLLLGNSNWKINTLLGERKKKPIIPFAWTLRRLNL